MQELPPWLKTHRVPPTKPTPWWVDLWWALGCPLVIGLIVAILVRL